MTISPALKAGAWLVALSSLFIAANLRGADRDAPEGYGYVRRINGAVGRIAATPLQGTFREGAAVTIHDKTGAMIGAGTVGSVYKDLVYIDVDASAVARIEKGFLVAANGKAETVAALGENPAIEKGLEEDTFEYCGMRGRTIDDFRSAKTMTPVIFDARAPHHAGACGTCHHESEESQANCAACHGEKKNGNVSSLEDAFHARCQGCHRGTRVASMDCDECHLPNREGQVFLAGRRGQPPPEKFALDDIRRTKPAVIFPHQNHAVTVRDCHDCHHKDERGRERLCSACHSGRSKGKIVDLKEAFHKQCKDCHKKERRGPTKCNECHRK